MYKHKSSQTTMIEKPEAFMMLSKINEYIIEGNETDDDDSDVANDLTKTAKKQLSHIHHYLTLIVLKMNFFKNDCLDSWCKSVVPKLRLRIGKQYIRIISCLMTFCVIAISGCSIIPRMPDTVTIALSINNTNTPYCIDLINDLKKQTDQNNMSFIYEECNDSYIKQIESIDKLLDAKPDYIIISPVRYIGLADTIKKAYDDGVKVIILDSMAQVENEEYILTTIKEDHLKQGRLVARVFMSLSNGKNGNILELQGQLGSSKTRDIALGFRQELAKYEYLNLIAVYENNIKRMESYNNSRKTINEYRQDIDFIFAHNDIIGFGAYDALNEANISKPYIISIGGQQDVAKAITAGQYYATFKSSDNPAIVTVNIIKNDIAGMPPDRETQLNTRLYNKSSAHELIN